VAENPNIDDLRAPLLAALGAADLALATVNDLIVNLRERAEETRTETRSRLEERRARLAKLQEDLPEQLTELRERFTADELRKAAEGYVEATTNRYNELVERGEAALERIRSQPGFEEGRAQAEKASRKAAPTPRAQRKADKKRADQVEGGKPEKKVTTTTAPAKKAAKKSEPAKKAIAKKAPAKKSAAKKVTQK
jgi:heparin binding hemagglutinin HbhA